MKSLGYGLDCKIKNITGI